MLAARSRLPPPKQTFFAIFCLSETRFKFCFEITSKKLEKSRIWVSQTLPKSFQKPSKINVPKNVQFFTDFCSKNVLLRERRHQFHIGFYSVFCLSDTFLRFAVRMHFGFEKPTKNASKTRVEPFKNRCQERVVFQYCFFRVLASSWRVLPPQDGGKLAPNSIFEFTRLPSLTFLNEKSFQNGVLEACGFDFGGPEARFWRVLEPFLRLFGSLTCYILPPLN